MPRPHEGPDMTQNNPPAARATGPVPGSAPDEGPLAPVDRAPHDAATFAAQTENADRLSGPEAPDYKDRWLRAEAEIQNTRRRAARDRDDAVRASEDRILLDLIEVLDDLERALAAVPADPTAGAWSQGVVLTAQRMRDALARRGVVPVAAVGEPFDPTFHEALLEVPAAEGVAPGSVAQEVQRGYRRGERALRAARVVVARASG